MLRRDNTARTDPEGRPIKAGIRPLSFSQRVGFVRDIYTWGPIRRRVFTCRRREDFRARARKA